MKHYRKFIIRSLAISVFAFVFSSFSVSFASSASDGTSIVYRITEEELTTLENNLIELERNNQLLKTILSASGQELTTALELLKTSQEDLSKLKTQLEQARKDAENSMLLLEIANEDLRKAKESLIQSETDNKKTQARLRRQRNFWEVLTVLVAGIAVAK